MVQPAVNSRAHRTALARLIWWLLVACTSRVYALDSQVAPCVSHRTLPVNVRLALVIHVNDARSAHCVLAALVLGKLVFVSLLCIAFALLCCICFNDHLIL